VGERSIKEFCSSNEHREQVSVLHQQIHAHGLPQYSSELIWMCNDAKKQLFVYEHDAGRLELLVRILYWILIGIVMWVYGLVAGICLIIQWFHILILGNRNDALSNVVKG
jgi:hypothetical protein